MYPALCIKRGIDFIPIETYMFNKHYPKRKVLTCVYELKNTKNFKQFEKDFLTSHELFIDTYIKDNKIFYIFDFDKYSDDFEKLILGQYSQLSETYKHMIIKFYSDNESNKKTLISYLYPEKFKSTYATHFGIDAEHLIEVCSKPDINKETLT